MGTSMEHERNGNGTGVHRSRDALPNQEQPQDPLSHKYQRIADGRIGTGGQNTADALGYFSLALGLAEVLAPGAMSRMIGVTDPDHQNRRIMRAMGVREIATGIGILSSQQPTTAVWARVAGDMLDLAFLAGTLTQSRNGHSQNGSSLIRWPRNGKSHNGTSNGRGRTLFATANVLAVTALDVRTARQLSRQPAPRVLRQQKKGTVVVRGSITVNKPIHEVYNFWRDFGQFPSFMRHLQSVTMLGERRSHWIAHAPAGRRIEWDAEITEDISEERISWRSLPGSDVYNAGTVELQEAPGGRGTEVRVTLEYDPPMGRLGSRAAKLWREEPEQQVNDSLRQFKSMIETGEVLLSDATKQRGPHPAQPDNEPTD